MHVAQERLDHRRLESIVDAGTRACIEPQAEVRTQGYADSCQSRDARLDLTRFDPRQERMMKTRHHAEFSNRDASVEPQSADLFPDAECQLFGSSSLLADHGRPAHHGPI
jgi:hypothetical protein